MDLEKYRKEKQEKQWVMATLEFRPSFWWNRMLLILVSKKIISIKTLSKLTWTK